MESSATPEPMFVHLDADEAYAGTSSAEWRLLVTQIENFKPLTVEDIEPENRACEICFEHYGPSDDGKPSEVPIQILSCGHVFGHTCIFNWLAGFIPMGKWWNWVAPKGDFWRSFREIDEDEYHEAVIHTNVNDLSIAFQDDGKLRPDWRDYLNWDSNNDFLDLMPMRLRPFSIHDASCPKCRGHLYLVRSGVMGVKIKARLQFWDRLYEKLGISRSPKEEQSRTDLLKYVQMADAPEIEIAPEYMRPFTLQAQVTAMRFALRRGNRDLDPLQTYLRDAIFNLGCYGLHEGEYYAISYENRRVPMWCYKVGRIERGLSPRCGRIMTWEYAFDTMHMVKFSSEWEMVEYSREWYRVWKQQISGPWRKNLFAEVGGDRDGLRWTSHLLYDHEECPRPIWDSLR
ncbi:hypothetical protein MMC22_007381 [Lobaria immixta]|nr:hypothetical protein [Lobaria immixta]